MTEEEVRNIKPGDIIITNKYTLLFITFYPGLTSFLKCHNLIEDEWIAINTEFHHTLVSRILKNNCT